MSTILNTLKKLEEEKSVLEKNVNLKGLLLQGQESAFPRFARQESRKWGVLGGLAAVGVLCAGLVMYFMFFPESKLDRTENVALLKKAFMVSKVKKTPEQVTTSPGIPLSGIPETEPVEEDDLLMDEYFFEPEHVLSPVVESSPIVPAIVAQPEPKGVAEIQEIKSLIQAATIPDKPDNVVKVVKETFEKPIFTLRGVEHIPGLKLKGIIFFSPENPANYIFIATPGEKSNKLKVGNAVMGATLESIEAKKAIFSYQGQRVEAHIGS